VDDMTLGELIGQRLRDLGSPGRPLSYRAAVNGVEGISPETLRRLHLGTHSGHPNEETIDALAEAIRVPTQRLRRLLGRTTLGRFELPRAADRLTLRQRRAVLEIVSAMIDPGEDQQYATETVTPPPGEHRAGEWS